MSISRSADNFYAIRLSRLLQLDFTDWEAYKQGVINASGDVIKQPSNSAEKNSWTKFHVVARNLKRLAGYIPGAGFALRYGAGYMLLKELQEPYGLSDDFNLVLESVVAGDSGGDPLAIASGETSGAITNVIQPTKKKPKLKKKAP